MRHLVPVAAVSLCLGACGGGDGLSENELVSQADSVCRTAKRDLAKLDRNPRDVRGLQRVARRAAQINESASEKLKTLEPPEEVARDYARVTATIDEQVGLARDLAREAGDGDRRAVARIARRGQRLERESRQLARKIGFKECGRGA